MEIISINFYVPSLVAGGDRIIFDRLLVFANKTPIVTEHVATLKEKSLSPSTHNITSRLHCTPSVSTSIVPANARCLVP